MITKWKVSHFKSICDETELDLGRLTVFAGANSSGKSTFIQSILLITQTLNDRYRSQPVVLNGPFVNLGRFDDIKSDGGDSDRITLAWTCRPFPPSSSFIGPRPRSSSDRFYGSESDQIEEVCCEVSFNAGDASSATELLQHRPQLISTRLQGKFFNEKNSDSKEFEMLVKRSDDIDLKIEKIIGKNKMPSEFVKSSLSYDVETQEAIIEEMKHRHFSAQPVGCSLSHFFPDRYLMEVDISSEISRGIVNVLKNGSEAKFVPHSTMEFFQSYSELIIDFVEKILQESLEDLGSIRDMLYSYPEPFAWGTLLGSISDDQRKAIRTILDSFDGLFNHIYSIVKNTIPDDWNLGNIRPGTEPRLVYDAIRYLYYSFPHSVSYLGPLRRAPQFSYPLPTTSNLQGVGTRGEGTAFILDVEGKQRVEYIPSKNFKEEKIEQGTDIQDLIFAVNDWLHYLGVGDSVDSIVQGVSGHEIRIRFMDRSQQHNLMHIGVGVSQVLPILVTGLLADTDSTIIFEQPELHLHPRVQSLLADFFLSLTMCDRQCIVETHSEHLINRLRYRIAASSSEENVDELIKVYFTEMGYEGTKFTEILINEYGAVLNWPEGFFDQSYYEVQEILNMATRKRKLTIG